MGWEGVGTRHASGLGICWALRFNPCVVIIRSDSGTVHALIPTAIDVLALCCKHVCNMSPYQLVDGSVAALSKMSGLQRSLQSVPGTMHELAETTTHLVESVVGSASRGIRAKAPNVQYGHN